MVLDDLGREWVSLRDAPELFEAALSIDSEATGASFLQHDEVGYLAHAVRLREQWPEYFLVLVIDGKAIARSVAVPLSLELPGREVLPASGWDGAVMWALQDLVDGVEPTAACALEINVDPSLRGQRLSGSAVIAMRENACQRGLREVIAPVRPPDKRHRPWLSMDEYAAERRDDGLPVDPWLRVHVRAGGRIHGVARSSMVVTGSLVQWREWTGVPFDQDGLVEVPGGLVPVLASQHLDLGVYVEPNVWVRHALT